MSDRIVRPRPEFSLRLPRSDLSGVVFPAVPAPDGAKLLALEGELSASQWWQAKELRARQFEQLGELIAHARRNVPFYRDRIGALDPTRLEEPGEWESIPILRRRDVRVHFAELRSAEVPDSHGVVREVVTSGSTGSPITTLATELLDGFWLGFTLRDHLWHRRDFSAKLAVIRHTRGVAEYPTGAEFSDWDPAAAAAFGTGPAALLSIATPVSRQIEWLRRVQPTYLLTYPSNLLQLARHCAERAIRIPSLEQVSTVAEALDPEARTACTSAWGCEVKDIYSTQEAGYLALQCPEHEHYHVQSEGVLLEVVDEHGRSCPPGRLGRVVVTPLHNFAMPLIRYDQGDLAEAGGPCPCGRGLPVLRRILGRARSLFVTPDGDRFWPTFGSRRFTAIAPVTQYQFVQRTLRLIEARLVTERALTAAEESALRDHICSQLPYPFAVVFTYHEAIARGPGGKYEDTRCEVWDDGPAPPPGS